MAAPDFIPYGKTARLHRNAVISEKLNGTNASVFFVPLEEGETTRDHPNARAFLHDKIAVYAQSRNRMLVPGEDNAGFGAWVEKHALEIFAVLGVGRFWGEWYGPGVQKNPHDVEHKRFALFEVQRAPIRALSETPLLFEDGTQLEGVPILYQGKFSGSAVDDALIRLGQHGTQVNGASENGRPEGIIVYLSEIQTRLKVLLEADHLSKTERGL